MILASVGGSGSLGKAILKQQDLLKEIGITKIRVISRDDQKHYQILKNYRGSIQLDCYMGDVCDRERMRFALRDAHFVINSAAVKHVDRFELDVSTGYRINIDGARNVADAFLLSPSALCGIFVSTDKACLPTTSYGISKLAAENLWLWFNTFQKNTPMRVCRYGNVFGSNGSVIDRWYKSAIRGEPIQITNRECTRFFISPSRAAEFVLKALIKPVETLLIPEMKSIEMIKLAEFIWKRHYVGDPKIEVTGLRESEKVHEVLRVGGLSSKDAERLSEQELAGLYREWQTIQSES